MQIARALLVALAAATLAARAAAPPAADPSAAHTPLASACSAPELHQFDFWIGDWDTFDADDTRLPIARTRITAIAAGCAIHELYEQADGLIGDSILAFDPVRRDSTRTKR